MTFKIIPEIKLFDGKVVAGRVLVNTFAADRTMELWNSFMPVRNNIPGSVGSDLYSLQIYPEGFFADFSPVRTFEKWAAVEVSDSSKISEEFKVLEIPRGLYAVFHYCGSSLKAAEVFQYILGEWLPQSGLELDQRPHFEVLGAKYKNAADDSEEDIWIPVRTRCRRTQYSVCPWFTVINSREAVDFYRKAFDAKTVYSLEGEGADMVARLSVNGAEFWVSNGDNGAGRSDRIRMILNVDDVEKVFNRALAAGSSLVSPVNEEHGWITGRLTDPFGIDWEISREL